MARHCNGSFNGDHMDVDSAHVAAFSTAWSIALWINAPVVGGATQYYYGEGRSSDGTPFFGLDDAGGSSGFLQAIIHDDSGSFPLAQSSTHVQIDGTWHQFIYAQDASNNVVFYTDGGNKETYSYAPGGHTLTLDQATMGALRRTSTANWAACSLAHFAMFNYTIGDADAALLGGGLYPNLLTTKPTHYWALDGTASPEPDTGTPGGVPAVLNGTTQVAGPTMHGLPSTDVLLPLMHLGMGH